MAVEASDNVLREIKSVIGVLRDPAEAAGGTEPSPRLARVSELVEGLPGFDVSFEVTGEPRALRRQRAHAEHVGQPGVAHARRPVRTESRLQRHALPATKFDEIDEDDGVAHDNARACNETDHGRCREE